MESHMERAEFVELVAEGVRRAVEAFSAHNPDRRALALALARLDLSTLSNLLESETSSDDARLSLVREIVERIQAALSDKHEVK